MEDLTPEMKERAQQMERLIRTYFDACNAADEEKITRCFIPEGVHYFPQGMYEGPFVGAKKIAARWRAAVETLGSYWTVDKLLIEPVSYTAVMEWTHFKTKKGQMLRGIEWYDFDKKTGLIENIRAYYASPQNLEMSRLELEGWDYAGKGYPDSPPAIARPEVRT